MKVKYRLDGTQDVPNTFKVELIEVDDSDDFVRVIQSFYYPDRGAVVKNGQAVLAPTPASIANGWANTATDRNPDITVTQNGSALFGISALDVHGYGTAPFATSNDVLVYIATQMNK